MKRKSLNLLSFKNPHTKNNRSSKINNKFKKSSTTQYNYISKKTQSKNNNQNGINSINNNIYLNLFNKFKNTSSLRKNPFNSKQIISNRINNNHINKEANNLNIFETPTSSSFIKRKNGFYNAHPLLINSMNFIDNHGNINIRLNLKNQFINNSSSNFNNLTEVNYGLNIAEKMKEKDLKIIQLQNDLLKSQEIINNFQNKSEAEKFKNINLNKSSQEKNLCLLTKSSESLDKILKTAFNAYTSNSSNIITKKKGSNRKNYKNSFLKRCGNKNILEYIKDSKTKEKNESKKYIRDENKTNRNIYSGFYKKKQSDYLRLFLPLSNSNNDRTKFNSYSNNKKNIKNKRKSNTENMNKTEKKKSFINQDNDCKNNNKKEDFLNFMKKCQELKDKTKNLLDKYINLGDFLYKSKIK